MKTPLVLRKAPQLPARAFYIIALALCALRLLLTSRQKLFLCPEVSMLDDMLMYKFARSVSQGEWLGAYGYLTLGKRALYAVWLALLNKLGVSVLFAGQLLAVSAAALAARALRPVTKNYFVRILVFAVFLFSPNAYADYTLRVYRANISSSAALLFFSCAVGFILRARGGSRKKLFAWGALAGLFFAFAWLLREDAAWLLPMAALAAVVSAFEIIKGRNASGESNRGFAKRFAALALSALVALGGIGAYSLANYINYGRFVTSDLASAEFTAAYGAMTRIVVPEDEKNPIVPVPASSREKLAAASPLFAELNAYLDSGDFARWKKDCGGEIEYSGGGFYWAARNAASLAGYYETPQKAKEFWLALTDEINAAADSGALGEALPARSGLNSPVTGDYIAPALEMSLESLARVASYADMRCDPANSYGSAMMMDEMEEYLNCEAQREPFADSANDAAGKRELVFTAVSGRADVSARLLDSQGRELKTQTINDAAGDIYLDYLLAGRDMRYTTGSRFTVSFALDPAETATLALSDGGAEVLVGLAPGGEYPADTVSESGIDYRIEYLGDPNAAGGEYGFAELWLYRFMRGFVYLYRALGTLMFLAGTLALALAAIAFIKKKSLCGAGASLAVCLGCLVSAALRIGMMAFADVSAFGLGVYGMYLADVYPLMTLWEISAIFLWLRGRYGELICAQRPPA